ncbi:MAG: carbamoyl-phosphate synthase large subunit [Kiritimatiellae bacterium]|nr:carbamoyl-phosphate synthase large subunit [Kiritimatiellia bacterium]
MKRIDIHKILIIGAGPIVIGQGCEFDYSGVQAVKALKNEGYEIVLVNSNPATVMTDPDRADRTYIEPLTVDALHEIIRRERPDALLPTLGGQTALNLSMELDRAGILRRYRVELIGAQAEAIARAEDRQLFKAAMKDLGLDMPKSGSAHTFEEANAVAETIGTWPLIVRPGFTLGGTGGGIAHDEDEFARIVTGGLEASLNHEVLIEESLIGWKEFEMEVMADKAGNTVIVCSIENVDPMGVHTGDSITVAPIQTLTDREYQAMRDDSIAVLRKIGIATGGSNVQWAVDPGTGRRIIIEMNPRVSRSSALASKATGFPIAKIAALLAVGYTLDEIRNDITGETPASFEPSLDYVVVKIPRFAFEKFPGASTALGTQMKAVGEVMAIGRTFKQAYLKAVRSLEAPLRYHDERTYDPWFRRQLDEIEAYRESLRRSGGPDGLSEDVLRQAKVFGFSDKEIAALVGCAEPTLRAKRLVAGIRPVFGEVDTCAGEFKAKTPYYYSYYKYEDSKPGRASRSPADFPLSDSPKRIMVLGGGPNRIGQGIEFDWCCCHAAFALRSRGYEVVMVNSNPETVSTDYDTSDRLYFEPLTFEDVMEIYDRERCEGVIVQYGGQTPLNLAQRLKAAGARIVGTSPDDIDLAEDRDFFKRLVDEVGVRQPASGIARSVGDAHRIAAEIGYPVLVRPSFVLGGRGMAIVATEGELDRYVGEAVAASEGRPILIDKFLEHAIELDVDCVSDGTTTVIGAILEHVEAAGCHSGDAAAVTPPRSLAPGTIQEVKRIAREFAKRLHIVGLMNIQLAVTQNEVNDRMEKPSDISQTVWMIEVNPRASRTVPFVSKAIGVPLADIAARCMVGEKLADIGFTQEVIPAYSSVKEAVFPFVKFPGAEVSLTPEMKSTGEVMSIDEDPAIAYFKSQVAAGSPLPKSGEVLVSLRDEDKEDGAEVVRELSRLGFGVYATCGTSTRLWEAGVESKAIFRISRGRPNALDLLRRGEVKWVVCTAGNGNEATEDSARLRSGAVAAGVPLTTTLDGFRAAVRALAEEGSIGGTGVRTLQEYHFSSATRS